MAWFGDLGAHKIDLIRYLTGIDGHNTLAVIVRAMQSVLEGQWLRVEY